jgi:hypothetical protein
MALSQEQKAANKEASLLRQAAYRARCKELEQAKMKINVILLEEAAAKARSEEDAAIKARNDDEDAIREQIALLQANLKKVNESHAPVLDSAKLARNAAYQAMYDERARQTKEIEARFPDLSRDFYMGSGAWVPPSGYIESFASEHADELSKKKAKRAKMKTQD